MQQNFSKLFLVLFVGVGLAACNGGSAGANNGGIGATSGNTNSGTGLRSLNDDNYTYYLYRTINNPAGVPEDYYNVNGQSDQGSYPYHLQKFTGWDFSAQLGSGAYTPGEGLKITPLDQSGPCSFTVDRQYYDPESKIYVLNPESYVASVFSVAANGQDIVLNPNIPNSYFNPNMGGKQIICKAQVSSNAPSFGAPVTITAVINPTPQSLGGVPVHLKNNLNGFNLPENYQMPIQFKSEDLPLNIYGVGPFDPKDPTAATYYLAVPPTGSSTTYTVYGGQTGADAKGCYYFPTFSYHGQSGQQIEIPVSNSGISADDPVTATWTQYCPAAGSQNTLHTTSGAVQSRDRFQYGTYEVTMTPSSHSGVNSSFYTFYGNGSIKSSAPIYQQAPWNGYYPWGYTWHEIDFEFVPGTHPVGQAPLYSPIGFHTPYTAASQIGQSVSLNAFSPGSALLYGTGSMQHHRYCPNPNDPECLGNSSFNPYDGKEHTFTITWSPTEIRYYFDHQLANILPIRDKSTGTLPGNNPLALQTLFSNGGLTDTDGKFYPTSPQYISMNFWIPQNQDSFGGEFDPSSLKGNQKLFTDYSSVSWSPCVESDASLTCDTAHKIGHEYAADGTLLPDSQQAHNWNFKTMTKGDNQSETSFFKDWMYAPLSGFDYNVSAFVQNGVILDKDHGLRLCMMNQWDNMAVTGKSSIGCDDRSILPVPGQISPTNFNQAMLQISVTTSYAGAQGYSYGGIVPAFSETAVGTYLNNGWDSTTANDSCNPENSVPGLYCANSNGWYADSRFEPVTGNPGSYQATYLEPVNLDKVELTGGVWVLKPTAAPSINGHTCQVKYTPESIKPASQQTYYVNAVMTCAN